jgi:hypothetical protein
MFSHVNEVARACIAICERNGHWESAKAIREKYFINQPLGALLTPKAKDEDSPN